MKQRIFTFIASLFLSIQAFAIEFKPFNQAEFDSLMQMGKPMLVDVYADWCLTCKRQSKVLEPMLKEAEFDNLTAFKVNYDTQKSALRFFKVNRQSTLIMFDNGQEVRRVIAETDPASLRKFITLP